MINVCEYNMGDVFYSLFLWMVLDEICIFDWYLEFEREVLEFGIFLG